MGYKKSFSKLDSKYWGEYNTKLSKAQNGREVEKILTMVLCELVKEAEPRLNPVYSEYEGDLMLEATEDKKYKVSPKLAENPIYIELIETSDLVSILEKYAEAALHKKIHLMSKEGIENGKKIIH